MLQAHELQQAEEQQVPQVEEQRAPQLEPRRQLPPSQGSRAVLTGGRRQALIWGTGFLVLGVLTLVEALTGWNTLGLAILPALAAMFLVAGITQRARGLFIPSGILFGVGVGTILADVLGDQISGQATGGIVVGSIGLGFLLIMGLQALFTPPADWWPLIPAAIMVFIGAALLIGGPALTLLDALNYLWPIALIALGAWLVWRAYRGTRKDASRGTPTQ
jgi:hypothetical protein